MTFFASAKTTAAKIASAKTSAYNSTDSYYFTFSCTFLCTLSLSLRRTGTEAVRALVPGAAGFFVVCVLLIGGFTSVLSRGKCGVFVPGLGDKQEGLFGLGYPTRFVPLWVLLTGVCVLFKTRGGVGFVVLREVGSRGNIVHLVFRRASNQGTAFLGVVGRAVFLLRDTIKGLVPPRLPLADRLIFVVQTKDRCQ